MNRSCFALSILLSSLAISLIAMDAARGIASEMECGFYPDWQTIASEADRDSRWTVVELRTHYDHQYDSAVYGDDGVAADSNVVAATETESTNGRESFDANSDYCHETWSDYACGHDWLGEYEEYQPYDYEEDHATARAPAASPTVDFSEVVDWTRSVIISARNVDISPGAWIHYVSHQAANAVAGSQLIQSMDVAQAEADSLGDVAGWPAGQQECCDQWDYWYDTGCDWEEPRQAIQPVVVDEVDVTPRPRIGRNLALIVARALDSTGRSLREASAYIVDVAGIEVTELSWNLDDTGQTR